MKEEERKWYHTVGMVIVVTLLMTPNPIGIAFWLCFMFVVFMPLPYELYQRITKDKK